MSRALPLVAALLLLPGAARAADWLGAKLPNGPGKPWPYVVDASKATPAGIDRLEVQAAFQAAFKTWDDVACSYLSFADKGTDSQHGLNQPDGVNVMGAFIERSADDPEFYDNALGGGGAVAAATPLYYGGTIYECDVGMNAIDYPWGIAGESTKFDLRSVALHESGHCLGLGHTLDAKSAMYAIIGVGELRRGLQQTDVTNLCAVYPKAGAVGSPCSTSAPCVSSLTCVGSGATAFCSQGCDPDLANSCPIGFSCQTPSAIPGQAGSCAFGGASSIKVGAPCQKLSEHADCGATADALCLAYDSVQDIWLDGYCTFDCTQHPCPASSHCYDLSDGAGGIQRRCLKDCRPGMGDCRWEYACEPVSSGLGRCRPACHNDGECPGGQCRACDGLCIGKGGGRSVGDSCSRDEECPAGGSCRKDLAGGTCVLPCGTLCATCPQGASCLPVSGEMLCVKACDTPSDCPSGLACWQQGNTPGCLPPCQVQDDCPVGLRCEGGSCLRPAGRDGGCELCDDRDAAQPGPDAAPAPVTPPKDHGCGCGSPGAPAAGTLALLCALFLRRRTRCRT